MPPQPWPRRARNLQGAWEAIEDLRERFDDMQVADEVERGVKQALDQRNLHGFTVLQKTAAGVVSFTLMISACVEIASALGWL